MRVLLCFQLTRNVRFNWNMYNFKFNFLSRASLRAFRNPDTILSPLLKALPCFKGCFGNLIFAIIARIMCRSHLNFFSSQCLFSSKDSHKLYIKQLCALKDSLRDQNSCFGHLFLLPCICNHSRETSYSIRLTFIFEEDEHVTFLKN